MIFPMRHFGGPTLAFALGGLSFLTDPTFDGPGAYPVGDRQLTRTVGATGTPADAGTVDAVLLSHDQHPDNLDTSGRAWLASAPLVLCTPLAAGRLGVPGATGLAPWQLVRVGDLSVTAVPAQHGPAGTEHLTGPVTGFVLAGAGVPTVYVSGDNASLAVVEQVAARFDVDVAVLFGGAARTPLIPGANLTLDAAGMVRAARILGARAVVPVHLDGWSHFTEGIDEVRAAFAAAGLAPVLCEPDRHGALRPGADSLDG
jgi:L-ascorbate metabolism protein UlaG (beta-lactamase superfamily)